MVVDAGKVLVEFETREQEHEEQNDMLQLPPKQQQLQAPAAPSRA